jgi:hypothetical protein
VLGSYFHRSVFNRIRSADNAALKYGCNFSPDDRRAHPRLLVWLKPRLAYIRPSAAILTFTVLSSTVYEPLMSPSVSARAKRENGCLPFNLCTVHFRPSQSAVPRVPGETGKIMSAVPMISPASPGTSGDGEPPRRVPARDLRVPACGFAATLTRFQSGYIDRVGSRTHDALASGDALANGED